MQIFDTSSPRFIKSFPNLRDGSVVAKYYQLLTGLFPEHGVFILLLNSDGELFVDSAPSDYHFAQPDILLHLLTNGSNILFTETLNKKPYHGVFCAETEALVQFFVCAAIKSANGRLLGGFGVLGAEKKAFVPDEKAFMQWLADNLAADIEQKNYALDSVSSDTLPDIILPFLDDIYLMTDQEGTIISVAQQVPLSVKEVITNKGGCLDSVFGEQHSELFKDLLELTFATGKKQTQVLHIDHAANELLFSVSCNRFSEGWFLFSFHDVTERNRLRELLENRKQLLENIVQAGNIGVMVLDSSGEITYYNNLIVEWLSPEVRLGHLHLSAPHWADHHDGDGLISPFQEIFTFKKNIQDKRYHFERANDTTSVFSVNAVYSDEKTGQRASATFFVQDVSARATLEQAIHEMEQHMKFMLQTSPVVIYQMIGGPIHQYIYISPNALDILGVSQDVILHDPNFWRNHVHPEDLAAIDEMSFHDNLATCEYRFWFTNLGEYRWLKDIRSGTGDLADSSGWIGALLDITDRKIAEQKNILIQEQLSATLESLVDAVISIDSRGIIIDLNAATVGMFGYSKDELLGRNVSILMPHSFSIHHDSYLRNYHETGNAKIIGIGREVKGLHADGREFPIALSIAKTGAGDNLRFVGCCHDLSKIKKQQEQIFQSEKLGAIGTLASSIAHDFNNILGIVRGYAEMLQQEGEDIAKLASPIIEASDRASTMISQLLDFSSSKQREVTLINLNEHLLKLKPMLEKTLSKGITLEYSLSPDVDGIKVELLAFDNLMINMAVNAKHAMNDSGILRISTTGCEFSDVPKTLDLTPGRYFKVAIADNGGGMSEEVRKKIFEPFFTTKGQKGTGLGLASAYGMVHRCHGAIDVQSVVGEGSCFNLFFPEITFSAKARQQISISNEVKAQPKSLLRFSQPQKTPEKKCSTVILLVDDEAELLEIHALLLESVGYKVLKANSGAAALSYMSQQNVDVLLTDIMMPEMSGFELAKKMKLLYPEVKVQLISGFAEESMLTEPEFVKWYEHRLAKPVSMTVLLQRVAELVASR